MCIKKIFIAAASTLSISLSANSATAEWKVFGKSNGGSEIALSTNDVSVESGLEDTFFNYRIRTKGKVNIYYGLLDCSSKSPEKWFTNKEYVLADSPASKAMLKKACQIARTKVNQVKVFHQSTQRASNKPQKVEEGSLQPHILDKFANCKEAKAAGISNVPVPIGYTPPGWRRSADADNDGIACEKK
jgi:Excalibur calcium-binding domain